MNSKIEVQMEWTFSCNKKKYPCKNYLALEIKVNNTLWSLYVYSFYGWITSGLNNNWHKILNALTNILSLWIMTCITRAKNNVGYAKVKYWLDCKKKPNQIQIIVVALK